MCRYNRNFRVFSYRACAVASKVTKTGQNSLHHLIPQYRNKCNVKFEYIWCATKRFLALCCKNWKIDEKRSLGIKNLPEDFPILFDHSLFMDFYLKYVRQQYVLF